MDINDLTVGQAKELAKLFGATSSPKGSLYACLVGCTAVIRSNHSGVWIGRVQDAAGNGVVLGAARRAFSWNGAATCSGLATHGPSGGKITAPVDFVVISECVEGIPASDAAIKRWAAVEGWVV